MSEAEPYELGELEATFLRTSMLHANMLMLLRDSEESKELVSLMLDHMDGHFKERM